MVPLRVLGVMGIGRGFLTEGPGARGGRGDVDSGVEAGAAERSQGADASAGDVFQINGLPIHELNCAYWQWLTANGEKMEGNLI